VRVYFQPDGSEEWLKGTIVSMSGGRQVSVVSRDDAGRIVHQITMSNTETLFYGSGFCVTGYARDAGENLFKLVSINFRWTKPRKGD
jgi:hypothetical protein